MGLGKMIARGKKYNKYAFKSMKPGEKIKVDKGDLRRLQVITSYYRNQCKRPINVFVVKEANGYHVMVL
jgi:hypothetical protein